MNRHLRLLDFAVARLRRRPARTLLVVGVYSVLVALVASLLLYVAALKREARLLLTEAPELVVQRLRGGRHEPIPLERAAAIAGIRGVGRVRPRLWGYTYDPPSGATLTLWAAGSVPAAALAERDGDLDPAGGTCLVGRGVAEARWLVAGQRLPLLTAGGEVFAPRVAGVFTAASALLTNDLVVLTEGDLRRVFDLPAGFATDLAVEVHNPREVATVARKVGERWPDTRTLSRDELLRTYDAVFDWRGGLWAALLLSSVAAFVLLVWDHAAGLSAEDWRSLGLLKAVGWSPREVMELRLLEGAAVSAVSLLTGVLLAQVHLVLFDGALFARVLRGWSVLFPPFEVAPSLDAYTLLLCLALAVVPYLAANLLPAWRSAVIEPDRILRS